MSRLKSYRAALDGGSPTSASHVHGQSDADRVTVRVGVVDGPVSLQARTIRVMMTVDEARKLALGLLESVSWLKADAPAGEGLPEGRERLRKILAELLSEAPA